MTSKTFRANGKLLLAGEYFVLDGALAIGLPTQLGQSLQIASHSTLPKVLHWESYNVKQQLWFEGVFQLGTLELVRSSDEKIGQRLQQILQEAQRQNPDFLVQTDGIYAKTSLDFPNEWGLGTSSTLIYAIATWAGVSAFKLLEDTMGGSGYDIACAGATAPILYQRLPKPTFKTVDFQPVFASNLYFVYLGKKQNSRAGIARYRQYVAKDKHLIQVISTHVQALLKAQDLTTFKAYLVKHEEIVAKAVRLPRAKQLYFQDYWGEVKSLGAWGGDFVLATSTKSKALTQQYFLERGFAVCLPYHSLIL